MRLGQPHMQRHQPGLGAEAEQREQERDRRPRGRQMRRAHGVERELPAAALHDAEHSRIPIAPRCAISRYRKPARRISGMRCCVVTRKYDDSAMVSHATMNA